MKRKRKYGMAHRAEAAARVPRGGARKIRVEVQVGRGPTGTYRATACVTGHTGILARCSSMRTGSSPTTAAGNALRELGEHLKERS